MPINVALILGEEATAHYHETGKVPSGTWLSRHDGEVCHRTYPDRRTYEAVREAISKMAGQQDGTAVVLEELPEPLPAKELWAFVFPDSRLPRNATDAQILADYQQEHEQDELTVKFTPDEFAAYCNDGFFNDQDLHVRFIYTDC